MSQKSDDDPAKIFKWLLNTEKKQRSKPQAIKHQMHTPRPHPHLRSTCQTLSQDPCLLSLWTPTLLHARPKDPRSRKKETVLPQHGIKGDLSPPPPSGGKESST